MVRRVPLLSVTLPSVIQLVQEFVDEFERIGGVQQCEVVGPVATTRGVVDVGNAVAVLFG